MVGKILKRHKKTRRSKQNYVNKVNQSKFTILGTNANGILSRQDSLLKTIYLYVPSVIQIQETKVNRANQVKIPSYQVYETIRKNGEGGSLLTAVHQDLNSVFISGGEDDIEILVVQAELGDKKCRFINAYGPQEGSERGRLIEFYARLDQEILNAKIMGCLLCIELDSNAKLGAEFISGDPHPLSKNGEFLKTIIENNSLIVCNFDVKC